MDKPWEKQPGETAKAYAAFLLYRDLPAIDRSVAAAWGRKKGRKKVEKWCTAHDWVNRAALNDADLAARRREHMAKELERAQDDGLMLVRADLAKYAERIKGMDAEDLAAGQIPAGLKMLIELQLKLLGYEDSVALKHEGKIEVDWSSDAAWVENYVRQLRERSEDDGQPKG